MFSATVTIRTTPGGTSCRLRMPGMRCRNRVKPRRKKNASMTRPSKPKLEVHRRRPNLEGHGLRSLGVYVSECRGDKTGLDGVHAAKDTAGYSRKELICSWSSRVRTAPRYVRRPCLSGSAGTQARTRPVKVPHDPKRYGSTRTEQRKCGHFTISCSTNVSLLRPSRNCRYGSFLNVLSDASSFF
jgi:hypothetical protein